MCSRAVRRNGQHWISGAACLTWFLDQRESPKRFHFNQIAASLCESPVQKSLVGGGEQMIPTPSWIQRFLSAVNIISLPLPRKIITGDPAFRDARLETGLRQRMLDEQKLQVLQVDIQKAHQSRDHERMREIFEQVAEIAYGKNVTPQVREDFIVRYGCTGWTDNILRTLVDLAETRGIVEIGAGHGQWARALTDYYNLVVHNRPKAFEFILAFDDMTGLPLSTNVYHKYTQPAHDYFFSKVQQCTDVSSALRRWACRGRVLLLVYPPPGRMALDTIKSYVDIGPDNDVVVYVGEGRGGSTANHELFDYLESGEWALLDIRDVQTQPGGKGYEKLFIFQHLKVRVGEVYDATNEQKRGCVSPIEILEPNNPASSLPRENIDERLSYRLHDFMCNHLRMSFVQITVYEKYWLLMPNPDQWDPITCISQLVEKRYFCT